MSISTVAVGVGQRVIASLIVLAAKRFRLPNFSRPHQYKVRLKEKLAAMPFLFGDMNLSAKDDYVALDVLTIPGFRFRPSSNALARFDGPREKFREYRRALIFGSGGYGKTTLFRNLALTCLDKNCWQQVFGERNLFPIYLPLKVVKTSSEFAIIEAIQAADPFLAGDAGFKRLKRLGNAGKLVLLLDGYDEMPYTGGFDHVRLELQTIFGQPIFDEAALKIRGSNYFERSKYWPLYSALRKSRVYLASRLEFFEYNPFDTDGRVQRWMVRGLGDKRIELVEKIFSKYRASTCAARANDLNAELFLQELIQKGDTDLTDLSHSPLFLTVMCYVYVRQLNISGESELFALGGSELSKTCIRLLLSDLDRYKSKDSSPSEQQAIINRRAAYPEEKYSFLSYFAVRLYETSQGYFDEEFVTQQAVKFFSTESQSDLCDQVLRGLASGDPTSNLVKQIILSGLFVLVDKRQEIRYFDFPHRKFREVLAVEYFDRDDRLGELLALSQDKSYSELVLAFIEQSSRRARLVRELIESIAEDRALIHIKGLFLDAIKRLSPKEAESHAMDLLVQCSGKEVELPMELLDLLPSDIATRRLVVDRFVASLTGHSPFMVSRWAMIAAHLDEAAAKRALQQSLAKIENFDHLRALIFSPLSGDNPESKLLEKFFVAALSCGKVEFALVDSFRKFYVGKNDRSKQDLLNRLNSLVEALCAEDAAVRARLERLAAVFRKNDDEATADFASVPAWASGWY